MAQDAIILYENGNAIGGEGHPTDADDITFDNSNTDLISEEVESAIKEVNEKTKHGIVELWKGSSSSSFAGQTITISDIDVSKYDSILIDVELWQDELLASQLYMFDLDVIDNTAKYLIYNFTSDGKLAQLRRQITITKTSTSISLDLGDAVRWTWNTYGSPTFTQATENSKLIPYRVLGLIHNS